MALTASTRQALAFGVVTLLVLGTVVVAGPFTGVSSGDVGLSGLVAVAALTGIVGAHRRRYVEAVRTRSELIERTHQEKTRRSVDAERLRIARELHDVVAHTMSTINVQAGVAAYVAEDLPPATAEALRAIKTASKDGLRELRAILAVLRQADDPDGNQPRRQGWPASTPWWPASPRPACRPPSSPPAAHPRPATGDRPGRLPDRAGIADQCDPARRTRDRDRPHRLWPPRDVPAHH